LQTANQQEADFKDGMMDQNTHQQANNKDSVIGESVG
jgi:hypothetical protein